jgi:hypothetical protein
MRRAIQRGLTSGDWLDIVAAVLVVILVLRGGFP